jgi:hypothetical protein
MALHPRTPAEEVAQPFEEGVRQLPGVLKVERIADDLTDHWLFRITIRGGDRATRHAIYRLEADLRRRSPGANLEIRVVEDGSVSLPEAESLISG